MEKNKFKQTELGKIPKDWDMKKLSDFCDILMGQSPPSSAYNIDKEGFPFFQGRKDFGMKFPVKSMWCTEPTRIANSEDVLLSVRAPVGDVNVAIEKCCIGRGLSALSMKNGDRKFLYYLLLHNQRRLKQIFESEGTVFGCVTKDGLRDFEVALPVKDEEQRAIAKILSDLDDKIEINCQMNKTLESIAHAIFKRWFVDFEFHGCSFSVKNNSVETQNFASLQIGYYKSSGGKMVNLNLGRIPEGWRHGALGEIISIESGKRPGEKYENKTQDFTVPLIGASSVMGFVKDALYNEPILIIGRVGTHGVVQRVSRPSFPSDNTLVIRSKYFEFVYQILKTIDYDALNIGTTQPLITQTAINKYDIAIPSNKVLEQFEVYVSGLFEKVMANDRESESLMEIRDSLLPRLMSGRIRVGANGRSPLQMNK